MNNELARKVLHVITEYPRRHDQENWIGFARDYVPPDEIFQMALEDLRPLASADLPPAPVNPELPICMTTACAAGWAAIFAAPAGTTVRFSRLLIPHLTLPDGTGVEVVDFARSALELSHDQSDWTFASARTPEEVVRGLEYLMDHPYATWDELEEEKEL